MAQNISNISRQLVQMQGLLVLDNACPASLTLLRGNFCCWNWPSHFECYSLQLYEENKHRYIIIKISTVSNNTNECNQSWVNPQVSAGYESTTLTPLSNFLIPQTPPRPFKTFPTPPTPFSDSSNLTMSGEWMSTITPPWEKGLSHLRFTQHCRLEQI